MLKEVDVAVVAEATALSLTWAGRERRSPTPDQKWTYSYSKGWPLMPVLGGATQPAILPGS